MEANRCHDGARYGDSGCKPAAVSQGHRDPRNQAGEPDEHPLAPARGLHCSGVAHWSTLPLAAASAKGLLGSSQPARLGLRAGKWICDHCRYLALTFCGCARTQMPDPRDAARQYEQAIRSGDAAVLHALLSREAQATYSEQDIVALLERDRRELLENAAGCVDPASEVSATALLTGWGPGRSSA